MILPFLLSRRFSTTARPSRRLLFFGTDAFSLAVLSPLHQYCAANALALSVACPADKAHGRGMKIQSPLTKQFAQQNSLPFHQMPANAAFRLLPSDVDNLTREKFDLAVVASFGYFLPATLLQSFSLGSLNVHPSLVPEYRGASPIQSALLSGSSSTGVSIIGVHPEKIDEGRVFHQSSVEIAPNDDFHSLSSKLAVVGSRDLLQVLPRLEDFQRSPVLVTPERPPSKAPKFSPSAGEFDCSKQTAREIWLKWRALSASFSIFSGFRGRRLILTQVQNPGEEGAARKQLGLEWQKLHEIHRDAPLGTLIYEKSCGVLLLKCFPSLSGEFFLPIAGLQLSGGVHPLSPQEFYNGYLKKIPNPKKPTAAIERDNRVQKLE